MVNNELVKNEPQQLVQIDERTLKDFLVGSGTSLSDEQFTLFLGVAKSSNLNPFKREIYAIPYEKNVKTVINGMDVWEKKTDITVVCGYQTYIARASETGLLDGWEVELTKTGARITIWRKDFKFPFKWEVDYDEFAKVGRDGQLQGSWKTMKKFMIKKVAIGQGFRLAFPSEMGGLPYLQEEISKYQEGVIEEIKESTKTSEVEEVEEVDYEEFQRKNFEKYYNQLLEVSSIEELEKLSKELKKELGENKTFISKKHLGEIGSLINDLKQSLSGKKEVKEEPKKEEVPPPVQEEPKKEEEKKQNNVYTFHFDNIYFSKNKKEVENFRVDCIKDYAKKLIGKDDFKKIQEKRNQKLKEFDRQEEYEVVC